MALIMLITSSVLLISWTSAAPPNQCQLEGTILDCSNLGIESIAEILPQLSPAVRTLLLEHNDIADIPPGTFSYTRGLLKLSLSYNRIKRLEVGSFQGLEHMETLLLNHNELCLGNDSYPPGVFGPLRNLRVLNLATNVCDGDAQYYPESAIEDLESLETFALSGLPAFTNKPSYGFKALTNLRNLYFIGNQSNMGVLPSDLFNALAGLPITRLSLRNSNIDTPWLINYALLKPLKHLNYLNIACNKLLDFEKVTPLINSMEEASLQTLSMDNIGLHDGEVGTFKIFNFTGEKFQKLRRLSLREFGQLIFDENTMDRITKLEVLVLSHVRTFITLPRGKERVIAMLANSTLTTLVFPYFNDPKFSNKNFNLQYCIPDDIESEDMFFPEEFPAITLADREMDIDINEQKYDVASKTEHGKEIQNGHLSTSSPLVLTRKKRNPIQVSLESILFPYLPKTVKSIYLDHCQKAFVYDILNYVTPENHVAYLNIMEMTDPPTEDLIGMLSKFRHLRVLEAQSCQLTQDALSHLNLAYLETLQLDDNEIRNLTDSFANVLNLQKMSLRANKIEYVDDCTFRRLHDLQYVDMADNAISVTSFQFSRSRRLKYLNLSGNDIPYLDVGFLNQLGPGTQLDIRNNSLLCNCNSLPFLKWLRQPSNLTVIENNTLVCTYNEQEVPIASVNLSILTIHCMKWLLPLGVVVGLCLLFLTCIALVYRFQWKLKFAYFKSKRRLRLFLKEHRCLCCLNDYRHLMEEYYTYDVFVAHDNADYEFVCNEFHDQITSWGIKTCIARRDLLPGEPVAKTLVDGIDVSRLVICLLTPGFASSDWCDFELNVAMDRGPETVIFIYKEVIPWDMAQNKTLRQIIFERNYLEYPDDDLAGKALFWDTLREVLLRKTGKLNSEGSNTVTAAPDVPDVISVCTDQHV